MPSQLQHMLCWMEAWLDEQTRTLYHTYVRMLGWIETWLKNMEGQKERWVDLKMDFRWWWTEMNKVWMNENRQITGWVDGWMDGCGKEGGKGWVVCTKRPKVKRLPWGVQTALQKSSQQSSRGLASSSSWCLTSAGGQTQVKLLQRRKPDAVKNP